jgi:hypothetical protein
MVVIQQYVLAQNVLRGRVGVGLAVSVGGGAYVFALPIRDFSCPR